MRNQTVRNNRCIPCALCGNKQINEYVVRLPQGEYGYFQCDRCKIGSTGLWEKSEQGQIEWNMLMRRLKNEQHR